MSRFNRSIFSRLLAFAVATSVPSIAFAKCDTKLAPMAAAAYKAGRYAEAARLFHRIHGECPGQATALYNAAGCEEKAGQLAEAKRDFEAYLATACTERSTPQCQVAKARSLAVASRMREVELERKLADAKAAAARAAAGTKGAAAGSAESAAPATRIQPRGDAPTGEDGGRAAMASKRANPPREGRKPAQVATLTAREPLRWPGWSLIGGGLASVGVGIAVYVWNTTRLSELRATMQRGVDDVNDEYAYVSPAQQDATVKSIEKLDPLAVSLLVVGGAAIGAGSWWLWTHRTGEKAEPSRASLVLTRRMAAVVVRF